MDKKDLTNIDKRLLKDCSITNLKEYSLKLWQPKDGYRFSLDAILLSEFVRLKSDEKIIDLGTGCGIIAILLARKGAKLIHGVEIQNRLSMLALKNIEMNNLKNRIKIIHADIKDLKFQYKAGSFDRVVTNPPYRSVGTGRLCPKDEEALARHEILITLTDILSIAKYLLNPGGLINLIYPADRISRLIYEMKKFNLEPKVLQFVHPYKNMVARLVLVEGKKDAKEETRVLEPVFITK